MLILERRKHNVLYELFFLKRFDGFDDFGIMPPSGLILLFDFEEQNLLILFCY